MNPGDFVACERITDKAGKVLAMPGDRCTEVPEGSLGWLARDGIIRLEAPAVDKPKGRRKQGEE